MDLDAAARDAFEAGRLAFESGRYAVALERFEQAHALSDEPALLFNIGLSADRLREDVRALAAYEQYLVEAPDSGHRAQVELRVSALRAALKREQKQRVPSPAEAAAAQTRAQHDAHAPASATRAQGDEDRDDGSVWSSPWLWAAVAVVIAGGATAAYVLTRPDETDPLPSPNTGVVVTALGSAP